MHTTGAATSWVAAMRGADLVGHVVEHFSRAGRLILGDEEAAVADAGEDTLTMDEAVSRAVDHADPEGVMETTGNGLNYQFRGMETDDDGNTIARIGRLDVNPYDPDVAKYGPHLNIETQLNGSKVSNLHFPIEPSTILDGDMP